MRDFRNAKAMAQTLRASLSNNGTFWLTDLGGNPLLSETLSA
jgi:hypothetical protein